MVAKVCSRVSSYILFTFKFLWVHHVPSPCRSGGQQQRICRGSVRHPLSARELLFENVGAHLHSQAQLHGAAQGILSVIIFICRQSLVISTVTWCHKF